jgi:hypothetical protein
MKESRHHLEDPPLSVLTQQVYVLITIIVAQRRHMSHPICMLDIQLLENKTLVVFIVVSFTEIPVCLHRIW